MQAAFNVLILSDNPEFLALARESVSTLSNVSHTAADICSASSLGHLRIHNPNFVVLDVSGDEERALGILSGIQAGNENGAWEEGIHVLLVSHLTPGVVSILPAAMEKGNLGHLLLPADGMLSDSNLKRNLQLKIAAEIKRQNGQKMSQTFNSKKGSPTSSLPRFKAEVILIGCSTGGPQALMTLLPELCRLTTVPILIVQHIQQCFTRSLAENLDAKCEYTVKEADDGEVIAPSHVYIAPGGQHMCLSRKGIRPCISLEDGPQELGCRPSVNYLFRSAPKVFGSRIAAAVLTGMGNDGTDGVVFLKRAHARIYAQDEASSVVWGMPGSALKTGSVDAVYPLHEMAEALAANTLEEVR